MARLVITHGTYLPGLIPILKRVSVVPDFVKTIIPGRMYKTRNNLGKGMELRLTTSQSSKDGDAGIVSQKVLARIGSQTQEVFFVLPHNDEIYDVYSFAERLRTILRKESCDIVYKDANKVVEKLSIAERRMNKNFYWK